MSDAQTLTELRTMLDELTTLEQGRGRPHSNPLAPTHTGGSTPTRMPFNIALDDPDQPADARTAAGITAWAKTWATHFADWYHTSQAAHPLTYLASISTQAANGHPDDWHTMMDEATVHHARTAARTGHAPQHDPTRHCPTCGGTLTRDPLPNGLTDWTTCTRCGDTLDDTTAAAVRTHTIRTAQTDTWITRTQARTLYPDLPPDLLRQWIHRGHIRTNGTRIHLADLNSRAHH